MPDCIFCKIVKGELPSEKVYETEKVVCFLDINPLGRGHTLVIPKKHYEDIFEMDEKTLSEIAKAAKRVAHMQKDNLDAHGVDLLQYNGKAGQQEVMHFHLHILPRYKGDTIDAWPRSNYQKEDLEKLAKKLRGQEQ